MALGSLLVILDPSKASESPAVFVAVGVLMGLMPLGVGLLLFGLGVRRLARSSPMPAPTVVAPASW